MSLLMDALRRAEAEKKQAQKDQRDKSRKDAAENSDHESATKEELAATVKLDKPPVSAEELAALNESTKTIPGAKAQALADDAALLGGRITEKTFHEIAHSAEQQSPPPEIDEAEFSIHVEMDSDLKETVERPTSSDEEELNLSLEPLSETDELRANKVFSRDSDNTTTMPSSRAVEQQLESYFDESQSVEVSALESGTEAARSSPAMDSTADSSWGQTVVTAHTVFEAGNTGVSKRLIAWTAIIGIAFLSVLAVAGIYYFQQAPTARVIPMSPQNIVDSLQRPVEVPNSVSSVDASRAGQPIESSNTSMSGETESASTATSETELPDPEAPAINSPIPEPDVVASSQTGQSTDTSSVVAVAQDPAIVKGLSDASVDEATATPDSTPSKSEAPSDRLESSVREVPTVDTRSVRIGRSQPERGEIGLVQQAYAAYNSGNFAKARDLYAATVKANPRNRDAKLGLAALALQDGDISNAHRLYSEVLRDEPGNPTASAALFQIEGGAGNHITESKLKLMLDKGGDPGFINFALGNLYARHGRWNDAQLAFFEALRARPSNPDYLYNLAVSLDQIGQGKAALDYYQQALTAADGQSHQFNPATILARINSLKQNSAAIPAN